MLWSDLGGSASHEEQKNFIKQPQSYDAGQASWILSLCCCKHHYCQLQCIGRYFPTSSLLMNSLELSHVLEEGPDIYVPGPWLMAGSVWLWKQLLIKQKFPAEQTKRILSSPFLTIQLYAFCWANLSSTNSSSRCTALAHSCVDVPREIMGTMREKFFFKWFNWPSIKLIDKEPHNHQCSQSLKGLISVPNMFSCKTSFTGDSQISILHSPSEHFLFLSLDQWRDHSEAIQ